MLNNKIPWLTKHIFINYIVIFIPEMAEFVQIIIKVLPLSEINSVSIDNFNLSDKMLEFITQASIGHWKRTFCLIPTMIIYKFNRNREIGIEWQLL